MTANEIGIIPVERLRLDSCNPRLPEHLRGASQTELLEYLHNNAALHELIMSFADNGFFIHEPLIVLSSDMGTPHDILEGNRRLAALTILLQLPTAVTLGIVPKLSPMPDRERLNRLYSVPCVLVSDREEVHRFLGFRHIGGIKTWSAEAKARYLLDEVRRVHDQYPNEDVFRLVGRAVGSNALGVRNQYIAMRILIHGREEFGIDISILQRHRFGVWHRAMNSPNLREYIGFGDARTYDEVETAMHLLKEPQLREVLADMTPAGPSSKAVLGDSRDVTIYAQILQDERAHEILRRYADLSLARQIIEQVSMSQQIRQISRSISLLIDEIGREGISGDVLDPAIELSNLARALYDLVNARARS